MLKEAESVARDNHDYSTAYQALYQRARIFLRIPENVELKRDVPSGLEERWETLQRFKRQFRQEAGEGYKAGGKYKEAAKEFLGAENFIDAIDMLVKEGSDESLDAAAYWAINKGSDFELGFDLRIERGEFQRAFKDLESISISESLTLEDQQKWGEYLTRALYNTIVEKIKAEIEKKEDKRPEGTLTQLVEGRDNVGYIGVLGVLQTYFGQWIKFVRNSNDPQIIQIGIELNDLQRRIDGDAHSYAKDTEMFLRGKLNVDHAQYFVARANDVMSHRSDSDQGYYARQAIDILSHHGMHEKALEIAERFLPPQAFERFDLMKKLGATERLAAAYRETNNPVDYALTVAKLNAKS